MCIGKSWSWVFVLHTSKTWNWVRAFYWQILTGVPIPHVRMVELVKIWGGASFACVQWASLVDSRFTIFYALQCPSATLNLLSALWIPGENCETNIDECVTVVCEHGGTCVDGIFDFTCDCPEGRLHWFLFSLSFCLLPNCVVFLYSGFRGPFCEYEIDACSDGPCINGACVNLIDNYTCECFHGWTGFKSEKFQSSPFLCYSGTTHKLNLFLCLQLFWRDWRMFSGSLPEQCHMLWFVGWLYMRLCGEQMSFRWFSQLRICINDSASPYRIQDTKGRIVLKR